MQIGNYCSWITGALTIHAKWLQASLVAFRSRHFSRSYLGNQELSIVLPPPVNLAVVIVPEYPEGGLPPAPALSWFVLLLNDHVTLALSSNVTARALRKKLLVSEKLIDYGNV